MSLGKLADLCGRNSSFILPSYDALIEAVSGQLAAGGLAGSQEISFHIEGPKNPIRLHDAFSLRIEVRNIGNVEVIEGSRLVIEGGSFFPRYAEVIEKAIMPGDTRILLVELKPTRDASVFALPEFLDLRVYKPQSDRPLGNARFPVRLSDFIAESLKWQPPVPGFNEANVLVFGELGAGKSTLINSLVSLFSKTFQDPAISLGGQAGHITTFLAPYETPNKRVRLIDSRGLKFERNEEDVLYHLPSILEGRYAFGKGSSRELGQNEDDNRQRTIHACILVLSKGFFSTFNEGQGSYEILREYINNLVAHNLHPIIVVTHAEKLKDSDITNLSKTAELKTGVHRDRIFCVDNNNPRDKALAKEKGLYSLLSIVLSSCDSHMKLEYDTSDAAQSRRRSPNLVRMSSSDQIQALPSRVQYVVLYDRNTQHKIEVVTDVAPDTDRLPKLRKIIQEHSPDIGEFKFVNVFSGALIEVPFEGSATIRCAAKMDEAGCFTIHIQGTNPPPYPLS